MFGIIFGKFNMVGIGMSENYAQKFIIELHN
jgi:hypothetical protein